MQIMPRFMKYLAVALLLAGGGVLVSSGPSLLDAHGSTMPYWSHKHTSSSGGACAHACLLLGHKSSSFDCKNGACSCKD